jgi:hypothetical protein
MFSTMKRRIGVLSAIAVLAALVPALATSAVSAAPLTVAANPTNSSTYSACPGSAAIASAGFTDTTSTDVDCIAYYGITTGVTATTYEPAANIPRWQMALYLTRTATEAGITLGSGADQGFTDISGESADIQTAINQLKQLGVTNGTTATTYSPGDNVTREQMAMFVERLLSNTPVGPNGAVVSSPDALTTNISLSGADADAYNYTDIDGAGITFEGHNAIEELYNLGIPGDLKTVTTFSPAADITRADMATWLTNALGHTNLRPAGINIQLSATSGWANTAPTGSVTYRDANFDAVSGQVVDAFSWLNATAVANNAYVNAAGQCKTNTNVLLIGNSLTRCYVDVGDPSTSALGNIDLGAVTVTNAKTTSFWVWTAASGTTYDTDTDLGSDMSTVNATSTATAGSITVTCDAPAGASNVGDAAPFYDTVAMNHGATVVVTMQATSSTRNNGSYAAVAQPGVVLNVSHSISQANSALLASVTNTIVTTDASGTATYSFTQADPNVGGTVDYNDATDDVSHAIVVTDVAAYNAIDGSQTILDISTADDKPCDITNAGNSMSFDFQDVVAAAGTGGTQDAVTQNVTSYLAGTAIAPIARTATVTMRDKFGATVANAAGTAVFAGGPADALVVLGDVSTDDILDTGKQAINDFPVGTPICMVGLSGTIVGVVADTVYYVQAAHAGAGGAGQRFDAVKVAATAGGAMIPLTGASAVTDSIARAHPMLGCATRSFGPAGTASVAWNDTTATSGLDAVYVTTSVGENAGSTAIRYVAPSTTALTSGASSMGWVESGAAAGGALTSIIGTPMAHDTAGDTFITKLQYGTYAGGYFFENIAAATNVFELDLVTTALAVATFPYDSAVCFRDVTGFTGAPPVIGVPLYVKTHAAGTDAADAKISWAGSLDANGIAGDLLVITGTPGGADTHMGAAFRNHDGTYTCSNNTYTQYSYDAADVFYLTSSGGVSSTPASMAGFEGVYYATGTGAYGLQGHKADTNSGNIPGLSWTAGDIDAVDYEALAGNISIFKSGG